MSVYRQPLSTSNRKWLCIRNNVIMYADRHETDDKVQTDGKRPRETYKTHETVCYMVNYMVGEKRFTFQKMKDCNSQTPLLTISKSNMFGLFQGPWWSLKSNQIILYASDSGYFYLLCKSKILKDFSKLNQDGERSVLVYFHGQETDNPELIKIDLFKFSSFHINKAFGYQSGFVQSFPNKRGEISLNKYFSKEFDRVDVYQNKKLTKVVIDSVIIMQNKTPFLEYDNFHFRVYFLTFDVGGNPLRYFNMGIDIEGKKRGVIQYVPWVFGINHNVIYWDFLRVDEKKDMGRHEGDPPKYITQVTKIFCDPNPMSHGDYIVYHLTNTKEDIIEDVLHRVNKKRGTY